MTNKETGFAAVLSGFLSAILVTAFDLPLGHWILEVIIFSVISSVLGIGSIHALKKLFDP